MKKILSAIIAAAVLVGGLAGCKNKDDETVKTVDLRFNAEDSYDLPAVSADAFTIKVVSSEPWTVKSAHPTWCIISDESGEASDPGTVFIGKAEPTVITVQYYDNTGLDDREDVIEIKSDYWVGKVIKVYQKGIAYLEVPAEYLNIDIEKAGGAYSFNVLSNQDWTAKLKDAENTTWIEITEGAEGTLDGTVTVTAEANTGEQRYASVEVFDRHDVKMATVRFTQDGLQLEPAEFVAKADWDQPTYEIEVAANASWKASKGSGHESDDWYTIVNPENDGSATLKLTLQPNTEGTIRESIIVLENVTASEEEFKVKKEIKLRQAYQVVPIRFNFDADEIAKWKATKSDDLGYYYDPTITDDGALMVSGTQISKTCDPPGLYVFHWSHISANARVRLWYSISESVEHELKYNFELGTAKAEGNTAFGTIPSTSTTYDASVTTHEVGVGFTKAAGGYCHVTVYFDGAEIGSFDTSANLGSNFKWGANVKIYLGVDHGTANSDSAVCEWYEYTPPFSWGDDE